MAIIQPAQLATGSYSLSGSFSGSFQGNGAGLNNIPSSAIVGLSSTQIASGAVSASVSTGTGSFTVTSGSSTFMFISSSGNVGIGTTTPSYTLDVNGTARVQNNLVITGSTSTTGLLNIINTFSGTYPNAMTVLFPNQTISSVQSAAFYVGKALSTNNGYGFNYIHSSDGSSSNRGSIAFYGVDNILNWFATGNVTINSTTDAGYKLDVNGTSRFTGNLSINQDSLIIVTGNPAGRPSIQFGTTGVFNNNWTFQPSISGGIVVASAYQTISSTSAIFEIGSTTRGFLPPRTNLTSNISTPAQGLMTYVTASATEGLYYYNSGSAVGWHKVLTNSGSQEISGSLNVNNTLYVTGSRVGIGTSSPNSALEVVDTGAASYVAAARFLVPNNNVAGRVSQFYLGQAMTNLNSIAWSFHYQGNSSTANYQSFGFNGIATPALTMFGTLNVGINTTTDAGYKLDVNGTARVQGNLYFGTAGSYLLGDTNNTRIYDKNNTIILQAFPNGVSNSETYLRSAGGNFSFLRLRDDYVSLEYAVSSVSATAQNPIQINRGYFGNVLATDKSVLYVKSTLNSNLSNATTLRGVYIDINDTTTYTGFSSVRAIEAPRGGAYFNTTSVNASAVLQADSTTQGFLPPRMTGAQAELISSPAEGLMVYATSGTGVTITSKGWWGFDGATWVKFN